MTTLLHVIPTLTGGGAERQLALLASEQARRGWNVHIALRRGGNYETTLAGSGVEVHELGDLRRGHPLLFERLYRLVRRIRPALMQTWLLQMDIVGGSVALATGVPWVLSERCSREAYLEFPVAGRIRSLLGKRAQLVIANSREGARYWEGIRRDAARTAVVGNAIDLDAIRKAPPAPDAPEHPLILSVGRLVPQKAHDVLIDAVARLPRSSRFSLRIIGDGPLREALQTKIDAAGLDDRVTLVPYEANWWGLLKRATAIVNPSRFEGQPNVVLEAMAAECPVIVSDIGPHRELVDDSCAWLVQRDDAADLARALTTVIDSPAEAHRRARLAVMRITTATAPAVADQYERIYARIGHG